MKTIASIAAVLALGLSAAHAQNVDVGAAEALMKKSGCFKCHSVSAKKDGAPAAYKAAVNCKACHSEHKAD